MKKLLSFNSIFILICLLWSSLTLAQEQKSKEVSKTLYFTSNTGFQKNSKSREVLSAISKASQTAENASVLLIGNLTPKDGFAQRDQKKRRAEIKKYLKEELLNPLKDFNGNLIFGPGYNEWNKEGHENIDDLESFLQDNSNSDFWPDDGCATENESLSDEVELIMVDSQWFLEDWDKHPYINNKCDIKTREQFFVEFKDDIKDAQGKTVIVAVHHPVLSFSKLGFFDKMGGFTSQSFYSKKRQELAGRMETLASQFEDVIFISGSDKNLQFIEDDGIPQIISGTSLSKAHQVKDDEDLRFSSLKVGYTKLTVFKDGSSKAEFFSVENNDSEKIGEQKLILGNLMMAWVRRRSLQAWAAIGWATSLAVALVGWIQGFTPAHWVFFAAGLVLVLCFSSARSGWSGMRLVDGLLALTGITKLFGDVLSYLRLFALGLASASLAMTFNKLAVDVAAALPAIGLLFKVLILLVGHLLNFGLTVISGVIHGLRLNLIEFYNWSLADEGYAFQPFAKQEVSPWIT